MNSRKFNPLMVKILCPRCNTLWTIYNPSEELKCLTCNIIIHPDPTPHAVHIENKTIKLYIHPQGIPYLPDDKTFKAECSFDELSQEFINHYLKEIYRQLEEYLFDSDIRKILNNVLKSIEKHQKSHNIIPKIPRKF